MKDEKRPFFARFLERQEATKVKSGVRAGRPPFVTLKYPSDDDEDGLP